MGFAELVGTAQVNLVDIDLWVALARYILCLTICNGDGKFKWCYMPYKSIGVSKYPLVIARIRNLCGAVGRNKTGCDNRLLCTRLGKFKPLLLTQ